MTAPRAHESDLGAGDVEQLDYGRDSNGEHHRVAGKMASVRSTQLHAFDAVRSTGRASDHRSRQDRYALGCELHAAFRVTGSIGDLDHRDDGSPSHNGCLGKARRLGAGAEDDDPLALQRVIALQQRLCCGDAHDAGQFPTRESQPDIATPRGEDRGIEGSVPTALAIAETDDRPGQPTEAGLGGEQAPSGDAKTNVNSCFEGFRDPVIGSRDRFHHARLVAGRSAHALAEMERDVEAHQGAVDGMFIDQNDFNAAPSSFKRRGQASRTRADDEKAQMFPYRQRLASRRPFIYPRHCRIPLCKYCYSWFLY